MIRFILITLGDYDSLSRELHDFLSWLGKRGGRETTNDPLRDRTFFFFFCTKFAPTGVNSACRPDLLRTMSDTQTAVFPGCQTHQACPVGTAKLRRSMTNGQSANDHNRDGIQAQ